MSAHDIGGCDVSEDSARRDSRNGKHKFLHMWFPCYLPVSFSQSASRHSLEITNQKLLWVVFGAIVSFFLNPVKGAFEKIFVGEKDGWQPHFPQLRVAILPSPLDPSAIIRL